MKKVLKYALMGLLCLIISYLFCQPLWASSRVVVSNDTLKPLEIGDQLPELVLKEVLNHSSSTLDLSQYKGKLIILDFWASWCRPCIASFPKNNQLQAQFIEEIQIIPVTYETGDKAQSIVQKSEKSQGYTNQLPLVVNEKVLHALFPHQGLPHYVWINPEGKIIEVTGLEDVTATNIQKALDGYSLNARSKEQTNKVPLDMYASLVMENDQVEKKVLHQSTLLEYVPGWGAIRTIQEEYSENSPVYRVFATNATVINLYLLGYMAKQEFYMNTEIKVDVKEPDLLINTNPDLNYLEWMQQGNRSFNYEISVPKAQKDQVSKYIFEDLGRYFPQYKVSEKLIDTEVWVLKRLDEGKAPFATKVTDPTQWEVIFDPFEAKLVNHNMSRLHYELKVKYLQGQGLPVLDETGYTDRIDVQMEGDLNDPIVLKRELEKNGLTIEKTTRPIKFLVFEDNSSQN